VELFISQQKDASLAEPIAVRYMTDFGEKQLWANFWPYKEFEWDHQWGFPLPVSDSETYMLSTYTGNQDPSILERFRGAHAEHTRYRQQARYKPYLIYTDHPAPIMLLGSIKVSRTEMLGEKWLELSWIESFVPGLDVKPRMLEFASALCPKCTGILIRFACP